MGCSCSRTGRLGVDRTIGTRGSYFNYHNHVVNNETKNLNAVFNQWVVDGAAGRVGDVYNIRITDNSANMDELRRLLDRWSNQQRITYVQEGDHYVIRMGDSATNHHHQHQTNHQHEHNHNLTNVHQHRHMIEEHHHNHDNRRNSNQHYHHSQEHHHHHNTTQQDHHHSNHYTQDHHHHHHHNLLALPGDISGPDSSRQQNDSFRTRSNISLHWKENEGNPSTSSEKIGGTGHENQRQSASQEDLTRLKELYDLTDEMNTALEHKCQNLLQGMKVGNSQAELLEKYQKELSRRREEFLRKMAEEDEAIGAFLKKTSVLQEMKERSEELSANLKNGESLTREEIQRYLGEHHRENAQILKDALSKYKEESEEALRRKFTRLEHNVTQTQTEEDNSFLRRFHEDHSAEVLDEIIRSYLEDRRQTRKKQLKNNSEELTIDGDMIQALDNNDDELYDKLTIDGGITAEEASGYLSEHRQTQTNILNDASSKCTLTTVDQADVGVEALTSGLLADQKEMRGQLEEDLKKTDQQNEEGVQNLLNQYMTDNKAIRAQKLSEKSRLDQKLKDLIAKKKPTNGKVRGEYSENGEDEGLNGADSEESIHEGQGEHFTDDMEKEILDATDEFNDEDLQENDKELEKKLSSGKSMNAEDVETILQDHRHRQAEIIRNKAIQKSRLNDKLKQKLLEKKKIDFQEIVVDEKSHLLTELENLRRHSNVGETGFLNLLQEFASGLNGGKGIIRHSFKDERPSSGDVREVITRGAKDRNDIKKIHFDEKSRLDKKLLEKMQLKKKKKNKVDYQVDYHHTPYRSEESFGSSSVLDFKSGRTSGSTVLDSDLSAPEEDW